MVRIDDLPDMTSTVCGGRTYIARNKINYPQMLPGMVNEKINRFLRKSAFTLMLRLHSEKQSVDRIFVFLSADKHHFVGQLERLH